MIEGTEYVLDINSVTAEKLMEKVRKILSERERLKKRIGEKVAEAAKELETKVPSLLREAIANPNK
jgi:hypothetical protein